MTEQRQERLGHRELAGHEIPAAVARMAVGEFGAAFITSLRGASNSRAKHVLGWRPQYASWRAGLAASRQQASPAAH